MVSLSPQTLAIPCILLWMLLSVPCCVRNSVGCRPGSTSSFDTIFWSIFRGTGGVAAYSNTAGPRTKYNSAFVAASKAGIHLSSRETVSFSRQERAVLSASPRVNGDEQGRFEDNRNELSGKQNDTSESSDDKVPITGWFHNLPSESSHFWQDTEPEKEISGPSESSSSKSKQLRTGWLHNTEPTSKGDSSKSAGAGTNKAHQLLEQAMKEQEQNHRIQAVTFHACGESGGLVVVTEHKLSAPLQYDNEQNKKDRLDLYFSIVEKVTTPEEEKFFKNLASTTQQQQNRAKSYVQYAAMKNADKMILYLQGGPGFGAPEPIVSLGFGSPDSSWAAKALSMGKYNRVVLMDQRGTGKSTPITKQYLEKAFPDLFLLDGESSSSGNQKQFQSAVEKVTEYMSNFRADNIVRDAEFIKDALLLTPSDESSTERTSSESTAKSLTTPAPRPWGCALGQSFGGFCLMSYLSLIEHPPQVLLFTGGIAPMLTPVYDVYGRLWDTVKERSLRYYDMYSGDVAIVKTIIRKLVDTPAKLPSGGVLTARRFLQIGLGLGGSPSSFASIHSLLSSAFLQGADNDESQLEFSRAFLKNIEVQQSFDDHPIYFWLHESIYADGGFNGATEWAAHRTYLDKVKTSSDFDYTQTCIASDERPVIFFGEMVFPWMAEDYGELSGTGLTAVANALAQKSDWGPLFDGTKMRSALETYCKAAAAVYHEDMYVEFGACMDVTARNGPLGNCKVYVTNEYQHSGLRDNGAAIFSKLHGMATGSVRTPS